MNTQDRPSTESGWRRGWLRLALLEAVRVGAIVGLFVWAARMPFGFFHPDEESWLFFWRYPPLWQLWVSLAISIGGAAVLFLVFSVLWRAKGDGERNEVVSAFRRVFSPVYFLLLGLIQLLPGALNVVPVLPLLNKLILPLAVSSSVILLFVVEAGLFPAAFLDRLDRSVSAHKWRWTAALFIATLAVYVPFTKRCDTAFGYTSGDEAHYLTQAESLAEDLDRDLSNQLPDYVRSEDYFLAKHLSPKSPPGKAYSYHSIGLPVLLAPGWAVGKMKGAMAVLVWMSSVFAVTVFWVAFGLRGRAAFAMVCWAIFCFTAPILFYACRAYPELPSAFIIFVIVWKMMNPDPLGRWVWLAMGCLLGFLPWLHIPRLILPTMFLSIWGIGSLLPRHKWKHLSCFVFPLFVSAVLLIVLNQHWYGYTWGQAPGATGFEKLDPQSWTGGYYHQPRELFSCFPGLIGTFIDRYKGLLANSPIWLVPLVAVFLGLFSRKMKFWRSLWLWTFLVIYVPALSRSGWYGGACFPSRFLISTLPLLLFPVAAVFSGRRDRLLRAMFGVLSGFSVLMTLQMFLHTAAFYRGVETAHWYFPAVKLLAFVFPYAATGKPVGHIEDPFGLLLFVLWLGGLFGVIHLLKRKNLSWHGAFNVIIAAIVVLPVMTSAVRRVVGIQPFNSVPADILEHYSALNDINHSSRRQLRAARWGDVRAETLTELLTLELLAVDQKSRTGDVWEQKITRQKVVGYDPTKHKPDFLSYTYPVKLHAGDYVVSFWLRVEDEPDAVVLDVQDMGTGKSLASRRVSASDLAPREEFSRVPLRFSLSGLSKLSFRVYVDSKSKVEVLKYTLQPSCLEELVQVLGKSRFE
ncbi:MAG: hypothetical protein Q8Q12_17555 [bacterium]|nr:hypothetical protein [bacterium]